MASGGVSHQLLEPLVAAEPCEQRVDPQAAAYQQRAGARAAPELVRGDRTEIRVELAKRERDLTECCTRVDVHEGPSSARA